MSVSQTLDVTETSYSVTNNTSQVRITWKSTQSGTSWNGYTRTAYYYYSVNGGSEKPKSVSYTLPKNSTKTIVNTTLTIPHKPDGSATIKVRTWMDTDISEGVVEKNSGTIALTTIPRASTLSLSDLDRTLEVQQTLSADPKSSSFTHTLTWACGTHKGTIATKSSATSWTFTPGKELSDGAPYGSKVYCSFKLTTYNGTTAVGSDSKSAWYTIPSSVKPSCSLSLVESGNKNYNTTYGGYIQGESKLSVTINTTQAYGSPISRYSASANGVTYSSKTFTTDVLKTTGDSVLISATVTDGRGRSGSASTTIKVIPYKRPQITKLKVNRCNSDGTANDLGAYCKVSFTCTITSLSSKNTKSCVLKYRQSGATDWIMAPAITLSSYTANCSPPVIAMSEEHSYEVLVSATDAFGTTNATTSVSTGYCLYHIPASGKGITFGGIAEGNGFSVKMPATFTQYIDARERIYMGGVKKTDDEKQIYFQSTENADNVHSACVYGGNGSSAVAIGMYDSKNSRSVMRYTDGDNKVSFAPQAHFGGGLTETIQVLSSGDCNSILTSGQYYIGKSGTNKPGSGSNGWLTVKAYGTAYCSQEYITYTGLRYRRMRDNGTWGSWIQEADFVVAQGTDQTSSGTWTYRKWNSGLAECWIRWTIAKPYSLPGICSYVLYLPLSFTSTDYTVQAQPSKNGKQLTWYGPFNSTGGPERQAGQMTFSMYYNNSTAYPIVFDIYIMGRWK